MDRLLSLFRRRNVGSARNDACLSWSTDLGNTTAFGALRNNKEYLGVQDGRKKAFVAFLGTVLPETWSLEAQEMLVDSYKFTVLHDSAVDQGVRARVMQRYPEARIFTRGNRDMIHLPFERKLREGIMQRMSQCLLALLLIFIMLACVYTILIVRASRGESVPGGGTLLKGIAFPDKPQQAEGAAP